MFGIIVPNNAIKIAKTSDFIGNRTGTETGNSDTPILEQNL
jgi:hypothetical protein